jgi:TolB protein
MNLLRRSIGPLVALALAVAVPSALPAFQGAQQQQNLKGVVRPSDTYDKTTIAVVRFNVEPGVRLTIDELPRIIRRDLELTGLFANFERQEEANRQNLKDGRAAIDFSWWADNRVDHYVMGRVAMTPEGRLRVRGLLYDIGSRKLIFDRWFEDSPENFRRLAHRVSDEIVKFTKGIDGVAQTQILLVHERVRGVKELAVMDADGFNLRPLTNFGSIISTPEWGYGGTEAYFTSYHRNRAGVYLMQLLSGKMFEVAGYGGTNHSPAWSPAGNRLAMVLSRDGNSEIYTSARDGTDLRRLTTTRFTEGSPAWSPDGKRLAFSTNEAGGVHIFTMNADGSDRRRVSTTGSWNDAVSWSPTGDRLVYVSRIGGVNEIMLADISSGTPVLRQLTKGQGNNESPVWAPNGVHIAFASNRSGQWQIYMMLDDGSNQRPLTTTGNNTQPSWGPLPRTK